MAKDVKYNYSGPLTGVTLEDGREVMLHPGREVPLPPDNEYVKALVAQKLLTEVKAEPPQDEIPPAPPAKVGAKGVKEVADNAG